MASRPPHPRRIRPVAAASLVLFLLFLYARPDGGSPGSDSRPLHRRLLSGADPASPAASRAEPFGGHRAERRAAEDPRPPAPASPATRGSGPSASSSGLTGSAAPAGSSTTWTSSTVACYGAVFVTRAVVGAVSLSVMEKNVQIDWRCFVRDVGFFLITLVALSIMLIVGKVTVWGAMLFVSIYVVYAFVVAANELLRKHARMLKFDVVTPLLPVRGSIFAQGIEEDDSVYSSLLEEDTSDEAQVNTSLPQWMWASHVAIYSNQGRDGSPDRPLWGWNEEGRVDTSTLNFSKLFLFLELPLTIPRKLTIPIVEEDRWSQEYAVASAGLSPLLLAFLWNSQDGVSTVPA
ncbi:hypothetical protein ZWY2020_037004 [Hordeum vulgare]|nr:hypothetical protein ZWY2020_037004 [Hordeum vulgare]